MYKTDENEYYFSKKPADAGFCQFKVENINPSENSFSRSQVGKFSQPLINRMMPMD